METSIITMLFLISALFLQVALGRAIDSLVVEPLNAVSGIMRPNNPLASPLLTALTRFSDSKLTTIFSASETSNSDVDLVLQKYASMMDGTELFACCASSTRDRLPRARYMDGTWPQRIELISKEIDLLYFPISKQVDDQVKLTKDFAEAVKKVNRAKGLLLLTGCNDNSMMCQVLEHFAGLNSFSRVDSNTYAIVMQRDLTKPPPSISSDQLLRQPVNTQYDSSLLQALDDGHLPAVFSGTISTDNRRYNGWLKVAKMVQKRQLKRYMQLGRLTPYREDGKGMIVLCRLARMFTGQLKVIDPDNNEYARAMTDHVKESVYFARELPVTFISRLAEQIDVLFVNPTEIDGQEGGSSQKLQLAIMTMASKYFTDKAVVVMDNCDLPFEGPCKLASKFLIETLNYKIIKEGPLWIYSPFFDDIIPNLPPPALADIISRPQVQEQVQQQVQEQNREQIQETVQEQNQPNFVVEPNNDLDNIFRGLMNTGGHRYGSFRKVAELAAQRNAKVFVETGTARNGLSNCGGDGCSTVILGRLARLLGARLHTVDISLPNINGARQGTTDLADNISYHVSDSVAFLKNFPDKIDILYLDSYDYDGIEYGPSQQHHLRELEAAWGKVHDGTVIFLDDCSLAYEGKCKMVSTFLRNQNWKLIVDAYQRVYVKN